MTKVLFRADGNASIGLGHVIRSLALAEMLKEDFHCVFAIQQPLSSLRDLVISTCKEIIDLPIYTEDSTAFFHELDSYLTGDEIVVLDGYRFNTRYQSNIKQRGCSLVCIDDIHAYHFVADIVINHAVGFNRDAYSEEEYTKFFFGPAYALLRKEFLEGAKTRSFGALKKEILICLGGADPFNETLNVVKKLYTDGLHEKYKLNIVIGAAYRYQKELFDYLEWNRGGETVIHQSINAPQMVELMRRAEIAVCAPSSVAFEYLSVSDGKLFLVYLADNQKEFYDYLTSKKIASDFFEGFNNDENQAAIKEIKELLDGNQALRYSRIFAGLKKEACRLN